METIYSEYATASQKIALVQEFYGADFALFKVQQIEIVEIEKGHPCNAMKANAWRSLYLCEHVLKVTVHVGTDQNIRIDIFAEYKYTH